MSGVILPPFIGSPASTPASSSLLVYDEIWMRESRLMVPRQAPLSDGKIDYSHRFSQYLSTQVVGGGMDLHLKQLPNLINGASRYPGKSYKNSTTQGSAIYTPSIGVTTSWSNFSLEALINVTHPGSGTIAGILAIGQVPSGSSWPESGSVTATLAYWTTTLHYWAGYGQDWSLGVSVSPGLHHFVMVFNSSGLLTIYLDGSSIGSNSRVFYGWSDTRITVGHGHYAHTYPVQGDCLLIRANRKAISSEEVMERYRDPFANVIPA